MMKPRKPGFVIDGRELVVEGRFCNIAHLDADDYKFLDDPAAAIAKLRGDRERIDLFTFLQKLPDTNPKYSYPFEWDNMAVLPISTYENWWNKQIGFKARNKAKQAEKKGVVVQEAPLNDALVRGIWEIYNETPVRQERRFPHYGKSLEAVRDMSATFLESSVFICAYDGERLLGFIKLVIDEFEDASGDDAHHFETRLPGQGADKCVGGPSSSRLCRPEYTSSGVLEIRLWKEDAKQSKRLQGAKWLPSRGYTTILRAADWLGQARTIHGSTS